MTGEIRKLLETSTAVLSTQAIEAAAVQSGMRTMLQDGILKSVLAKPQSRKSIRRSLAEHN